MPLEVWSDSEIRRYDIDIKTIFICKTEKEEDGRVGEVEKSDSGEDRKKNES